MERTKHYYHRRAAEIMDTIQYATVATVTDYGQPWNSPVFALHDSEGCMYWFSDKEGQHSKNVRHNGTAFIVIYDSTVSEGKGEGVYLQVKVSQLDDLQRFVRCGA